MNDQDISPEVKRAADKLQELADRKYRGKVVVVFRPEGVLKGLEINEFFHAESEQEPPKRSK